MNKKLLAKPQPTVGPAFAKTCVHCEHYHQRNVCCFCKRDYYAVDQKTREQHLAELGDMEDSL